MHTQVDRLNRLSRIGMLVALLLSVQVVTAQVGINNTDPTEMLDVEGNVRIRQLGTDPPNFSGGDRVLLVESDGTLKKSSFNTNNIDVDGGVINITVTGGGDVFYGIGTRNLTPASQYDDLDLALDGTNEDNVVIRILGPTGNFNISGISGGINGRHLILVNTTGGDMEFNNEDASSAEANRIINLLGSGNGKNKTQGTGTAELLYSGVDQRWILYRIQ